MVDEREVYVFLDRGEHWEEDSDDDDVTDLIDGATDATAAAESDAAAETKVRTATGDAEYTGERPLEVQSQDHHL